MLLIEPGLLFGRVRPRLRVLLLRRVQDAAAEGRGEEGGHQGGGRVERAGQSGLIMFPVNT